MSRSSRGPLEDNGRPTDTEEESASHQGATLTLGLPVYADENRWGIEVLRQAAEFAAGHNVCLAIEPLNRFECYFLNTMADAHAFVGQIAHPNCKLLYDTHHSNIDFNIFEGKVVRGIASHTISQGKLVWVDGELRAERGAGRYIDRPPYAEIYETIEKRIKASEAHAVQR